MVPGGSSSASAQQRLAVHCPHSDDLTATLLLLLLLLLLILPQLATSTASLPPGKSEFLRHPGLEVGHPGPDVHRKDRWELMRPADQLACSSSHN